MNTWVYIVGGVAIYFLAVWLFLRFFAFIKDVDEDAEKMSHKPKE